MRTPSVIEKLQATGYTVREIPRAELPLSSRTISDWLNEKFFELSIGGHKVWNNQDQYGWFMLHELVGFAGRVPDVTQSSFLEAAHASS